VASLPIGISDSPYTSGSWVVGETDSDRGRLKNFQGERPLGYTKTSGALESKFWIGVPVSSISGYFAGSFTFISCESIFARQLALHSLSSPSSPLIDAGIDESGVRDDSNRLLSALNKSCSFLFSV